MRGIVSVLAGGQAHADQLPPGRALTGRQRFFPEATDAQWNDWRWQFRNRVTTVDELLKLMPKLAPQAEMQREVLRDFRMGIPPYYMALIDPDLLARTLDAPA